MFYVIVSLPHILASPKRVDGFKALFFFFFKASVTAFVENLINGLNSLLRKCMFTQNHIQFQRVQKLLKLQKEALLDHCSFLSAGPFVIFPLAPVDPWLGPGWQRSPP